MILRRLALALRLPPHVVARRAAGMIWRRLSARWEKRADFARPTYGALPADGRLQPLLHGLDIGTVQRNAPWLCPLADLYRQGRFDLLGSGWVRVAHGLECAGVEGHRYPAGPAVTPDPQGAWLTGRINPANLGESQRIWSMTTPDYQPIDWHLDFKSGYRWREDQWSPAIAFGHLPGVDVKVPWELGRLQHLPILALAQVIEKSGANAQAFRNQVLDFIATNPPGFGVNWRCPMDVAIRAANLVLARDLFRLADTEFDGHFDIELNRSVRDHGKFILRRLEWFPEGRGNHYLADISGLLFIAASLPSSPESDLWLAFAAQELLAETDHQFDADGANFEASTCYHRLSAEMVAFGTAVLCGLPQDRKDRIASLPPRPIGSRPKRALGKGRRLPDQSVFTRLQGMAAFTSAVTKPNGHVAQIGDNDSGRFFKLHPILSSAPLPEEDMLDHRPLIAALDVLTGRQAADWLDAAIVKELASTRPPTDPPTDPHGPFAAARRDAPLPDETGQVLELHLPGPSLRDGLELFGYADFGLWIFRSARLFLAVRCGPLGQAGRGGHDHNDQLSIELSIDGQDWLADPGTYLYTASSTCRNAYRSVLAHAAPRMGALEPASLSLGDFWLGNQAQAHCDHFSEAGFSGHHQGFGQIVRRTIKILDDRILIIDAGLGADSRTLITDAAQLRTIMGLTIPFSAGYGKRCAS